MNFFTHKQEKDILVQKRRLLLTNGSKKEYMVDSINKRIAKLNVILNKNKGS